MVKETLIIEGMACPMCESHINDCIRQNFSVKKVTSSHANGETVVICENALDEEKLKSVISATGYELKDVKSKPYEKKGGIFGFLKK